jgi:hypothetical protein
MGRSAREQAGCFGRGRALDSDVASCAPAAGTLYTTTPWPSIASPAAALSSIGPNGSRPITKLEGKARNH